MNTTQTDTTTHTTRFQRFAFIGAVSIAVLASPIAAMADGAESGPGASTTVAPARTTPAAPAKTTPGATTPATTATTVPGKSKYDLGKEAIERKDWKVATALFAEVVKTDPGNADAWNLYGYSTRKGGNPKAAIGLYDKALKLNPKHLGALEYQGEAFVELKQIPKAKKNLALIKAICGTTCEQYVDLAKMIGKK
jgi:tetratricopeptide (TPR) repeat protein